MADRNEGRANSLLKMPDFSPAHSQVLHALGKEAARAMQPAERKDFLRFLSFFIPRLSTEDLTAMKPRRFFPHAQRLFRHVRATPKGKINLSVSTSAQRGTTYIHIVMPNVPFAVGSVLNILADKRIYIHSQQNFILPIHYEAKMPESLGSGQDELAVMRFVIEPLSSQEGRETRKAVLMVCRSLLTANKDWSPMEGKFQEAIEDYVDGRTQGTKESRKIDFLRWIKERRCVLLGYYRYEQEKKADSLGICQGENKELNAVLARIPARAGIRFLKIPFCSMIHRPVWTDMITIGTPATGSTGIVEHRLLLLYAFDFFNEVLSKIPYLGEHLNTLMQKLNEVPNSYRGRALRYVISRYPRDELLHLLEQKELVTIAKLMLEAFSYTAFRSFFYYSREGFFANLVIIIPRDNYDSRIRPRIERVLRTLLQVEKNDFNVLFTESRLAFLFLSFPLKPGRRPHVNQGALTQELERIGISWRYRLRAALLERKGEQMGISLHKRFVDVFPATYRDSFSPAQASCDVETLHRLSEGEKRILVELRKSEQEGQCVLRIFDEVDGLVLARLVHLLENMGVEPLSSSPYVFHDAMARFRLVQFRVAIKQDAARGAKWEEFRANFEKNVAACYEGRAENDGFNRLTTRASLPYEDIALLRAWTSYLVQVQGLYGREHIEEALVANPRAASLLGGIFSARFSPAEKNSTDRETTRNEEMFLAGLEDVRSLEQDEILRSIHELIKATVRTNFYSRADTVSFKFLPRQLSFGRPPVPLIEIFVYAADFEGVHLRNGLRARGGIRWSDRRASYREEIHGLFRAQIIKNAVIVPTGAKGGFYIKNAECAAAAVYERFISALLELTDNITTKVMHPPCGRIYDAEDPYLVVAPDKGTAGFSDLANEISRRYDYWLDDAFASSGSTGYNHKDMGITARGAWKSVERMCAELGMDASGDSIEVIGVGGMSGDVFGNGMLLSSRLKLIAAFNHRHIFIDPNPDPRTSYRERKRLFQLPTSSWHEYRKLSAGGGVYERSAKRISLSPAACKKLAIKQQPLTPNRLIRHLLQTRADLLFFGGIGTYVRASHEQDAEVGDKTNDMLRVAAPSLKVRVIGEGANLGMTNAARIEFASLGGKVATDSNDNSGGVHCSDREVNIKILLSLMERKGDLARPQRNRLLKAMTAEIARQVLDENYFQNLCLSMENLAAENFYTYHIELAQSLAGGELLQRTPAAEKLTRPQLAILLGQYKNRLKEDFGDCDLSSHPVLCRQGFLYYPPRLRKRAAEWIEKHPLANPILAVRVVNNMVDNLGFSIDLTATDKTQLPFWAQSFYAANEIFSFIALNRELSSPPSRYPSRMSLLLRLRHSFAAAVSMMMHTTLAVDIKKEVADCSRLVSRHPFFKNSYESILGMGVDEKQATQATLALAAEDLLFLAPLARRHKVVMEKVLTSFYMLDQSLEAARLRKGLLSMQGENSWRRQLSRDTGLRLNESLGLCMKEILSLSAAEWQRKHQGALDDYRRALRETEGDVSVELIQYLLSTLRRMNC